jgi:hypothetical protein
METTSGILMLILSSFGDPIGKAPEPSKDNRLLSRVEYVVRNQQHALELRVLSVPFDAGPIRRFRFQIISTPLGNPNQNIQPEDRVLLDLPDIPTHDVLGEPPTARGGALVVDWQTRKAFVIVGKAIGSGLILRAYEVSFQQDNDGRLTLEAGKEPTAETTAKLKEVDDDGPLSINAEMLTDKLFIRASRTRNVIAETKLRFDRNESKFVKESD